MEKSFENGYIPMNMSEWHHPKGAPGMSLSQRIFGLQLSDLTKEQKRYLNRIKKYGYNGLRIW